MTTFYRVQLRGHTDGTPEQPHVRYRVEFIHGLSVEPVPRLLRDLIAIEQAIDLVPVVVVEK